MMEARQIRPIPFPRLTALLAVVLLAAGAVCFTPRSGERSAVLGTNGPWEVRRGNGLGGPETKWTGSPATDEMLLMGPGHPMPQDAAPSARGVTAMVGSYLNADPAAALRTEVIYALCAMEFEHSLRNAVRITVGALSQAQLEDRRRDALNRYMEVLPVSEAAEAACRAAPDPEESEHRTGLAFDISLLEKQNMSVRDPLLRTEAGRWLAENMGRYGFIRRFGPDDRAQGCENIHLRYVGVVHAAAMGALGLELEDYLDLLHREGAVTLYRDGEAWAAVYCAPIGEPLRFPLPSGGDVRAGYDNCGYAIAAVCREKLIW